MGDLEGFSAIDPLPPRVAAISVLKERPFSKAATQIYQSKQLPDKQSTASEQRVQATGQAT